MRLNNLKNFRKNNPKHHVKILLSRQLLKLCLEQGIQEATICVWRRSLSRPEPRGRTVLARHVISTILSSRWLVQFVSHPLVIHTLDAKQQGSPDSGFIWRLEIHFTSVQNYGTVLGIQSFRHSQALNMRIFENVKQTKNFDYKILFLCKMLALGNIFSRLMATLKTIDCPQFLVQGIIMHRLLSECVSINGWFPGIWMMDAAVWT